MCPPMYSSSMSLVHILIAQIIGTIWQLVFPPQLHSNSLPGWPKLCSQNSPALKSSLSLPMAFTSNPTYGPPELTLSFHSHPLLQALIHPASSTCNSFLLFLNNRIKMSSIFKHIHCLVITCRWILKPLSTLHVVCAHSIGPCSPLRHITNYSLLCLAASFLFSPGSLDNPSLTQLQEQVFPGTLSLL